MRNLEARARLISHLKITEEENSIDELDLFFSEGSEVPNYWWKKNNMDVLKVIHKELSKLDGVGKILSIENGIQLAEILNNSKELGDLELIFIKNTLLKVIRQVNLLRVTLRKMTERLE